MTTIKDGQEFYDEPVYLRLKPVSVIAASLTKAYKRKLPAPLLAGHDRVQLRWMKPGPDGKLVPR